MVVAEEAPVEVREGEARAEVPLAELVAQQVALARQPAELERTQRGFDNRVQPARPRSHPVRLGTERPRALRSPVTCSSPWEEMWKISSGWNEAPLGVPLAFRPT